MKKTTTLIIFITILLTALSSSAQKLTSHKGEVDNGYNFWLYNPNSDPDEEEAKPLIIFLHGASLCGNNLDRVRRYGTIDAIEKGYKPDAFVIAPQNPGGAWSPDRVMNVFDYVADNHNIDYDRIYVLGMSLGGYGTIDMVAKYPEYIAAAMAFCGGASTKDISGLNDVPLWIIHGTADRAVSVSQSDKVVAQMEAQAGGIAPRLIYDRIPGMNHGGPARMFYLPESYDWLFKHSLKDEGRFASEAFSLKNGILKKAYGKSSKKVRKSKSSSAKKKHRSKRRPRRS